MKKKVCVCWWVHEVGQVMWLLRWGVIIASLSNSTYDCFLKIFFLNWSIVDLQCFFSFCCTAEWPSHTPFPVLCSRTPRVCIPHVTVGIHQPPPPHPTPPPRQPQFCSPWQWFFSLWVVFLHLWAVLSGSDHSAGSLSLLLINKTAQHVKVLQFLYENCNVISVSPTCNWALWNIVSWPWLSLWSID